MHELQKLLVVQCGGKAIMCVIDWDNHTSWFEVTRYGESVKCDTFAEAESNYKKMKG